MRTKINFVFAMLLAFVMISCHKTEKQYPTDEQRFTAVQNIESQLQCDGDVELTPIFASAELPTTEIYDVSQTIALYYGHDFDSLPQFDKEDLSKFYMELDSLYNIEYDTTELIGWYVTYLFKVDDNLNVRYFVADVSGNTLYEVYMDYGVEHIEYIDTLELDMLDDYDKYTIKAIRSNLNDNHYKYKQIYDSTNKVRSR